jgi:hypothetical protein
MLYPFRTVIEPISPRILGIVSMASFRNDADTVIFIAGILYFLLFTRQYRWPKLLSGSFIIAQIILFLIFQVRAAYVGILVVITFLFMTQKKKIVLKILMGFMAVFMIGLALNFSLPGRRGESDVVAPDTVINEIKSILFYRQSGTASFRILWWNAIIDDSLRNPALLFFGKGFGPSLVTASYFEVGEYSRKSEEIGGLAKSPHNILISIFSRMGLTGLLLWIGSMTSFYCYIFKGLKVCKKVADMMNYNIIIWVACFVSMVIGTSLFGVLLESPFTAIPFFFFMGMSMGIVDKVLFQNNVTTTKSLPL